MRIQSVADFNVFFPHNGACIVVMKCFDSNKKKFSLFPSTWARWSRRFIRYSCDRIRSEKQSNHSNVNTLGERDSEEIQQQSNAQQLSRSRASRHVCIRKQTVRGRRMYISRYSSKYASYKQFWLVSQSSSLVALSVTFDVPSGEIISHYWPVKTGDTQWAYISASFTYRKPRSSNRLMTWLGLITQN